MWAIGSGETATGDIITKTHKMIRNILNDIGFDGEKISILYGGSVNRNNAKDLISLNEVDGFLIGGASLDVNHFMIFLNLLRRVLMYSILVFVLVLVSILLIGIILLQSGQGDMGAAMGGNTMNQAFGSEGADKLLVRITTALATIFMILAISIQLFGKSETTNNIEGLPNTVNENPIDNVLPVDDMNDTPINLPNSESNTVDSE